MQQPNPARASKSCNARGDKLNSFALLIDIRSEILIAATGIRRINNSDNGVKVIKTVIAIKK